MEKSYGNWIKRKITVSRGETFLFTYEGSEKQARVTVGEEGFNYVAKSEDQKKEGENKDISDICRILNELGIKAERLKKLVLEVPESDLGSSIQA